MAFHDRLKELRKEKGWSQDQLGRKLRISSRVIGYYESGDRFPKDEQTLLDIARLFEVSLDYLLDNPVRLKSACPAHFCYMKEMPKEDRDKVNEYIRFLYWKERENLSPASDKAASSGE